MNFQVIRKKLNIIVMNFSDIDMLSFKSINSSFCRTMEMITWNNIS